MTRDRRRAGCRKLHYLNPVPIRLIHERWILSGLKTLLETGSKLEITSPEPAEVPA